jgi:hypothetical protein
MDNIALDRFLTTEPSQLHYDKWLDEVLSHISEEDISSDDFNKDFDNFIEPLLIKLSTAGTLPHGFVRPSFAALVVNRRWWFMNKQREMKAYMVRKKKFFEDNINWWNQII